MVSSPPKTPTSPADLWQSISKLVALQNQMPPLQPVPRETPLPLSFPQERLWWINQLHPDDSSHHISLGFWLTGKLNITALQQALQTVVDRHEALRTCFSDAGDQPIQQIKNGAEIDLQVIDLQSLAAAEQEPKAQELATGFIQRPFDLATDLPIRATLLHLNPQEFVLVLVVHHIVFDGWSEGVLLRDLSTAYGAWVQQQPPQFPHLPIQYADFSVWQRQWLRDDLEATLLNYWTTHLEGRLAVPELPAGPDTRRREKQLSACQTLCLDEALTQDLRTLSNQQGATLFATLLTAFKVVLHHYCNQDQLMVCTPVANRNRSELKDLIGYFVNLLLLQTDLSGEPTFATALQRVRQTVTQAFAHQDLPVQRLVSQFKGRTKAAVSRVMFALQNTPNHPLALSEMQVAPWSVGGEMADFDLFLSIVDQGGVLSITLKYNSGLFDNGFSQTLLAHFRQVLMQATTAPDQPLSAFLALSDADRQALRAQQPEQQQELQPDPEIPWAAEVPRDQVETALVEIWEALLGVRPRRQDDFFELGGQSLIAVQLLSEIEARFGKKLPLNMLLQASTIEKLAEVIRESKATQLWPVLVPLQTGEQTAQPPLFGIHGVGGGAMFYRDIAKYLDPAIPVYALQSLGMDGIQTPLERVEDMAARYIEEIRQVQDHGPYYLAGYSFGGFIALEIAQRLMADGETVSFLAMLDAPTPDLAHRKPSLWEYASTHLINLWNEAPSKRPAYILKRLKWILMKQKINNRDYETEVKLQNPQLRMYQVLGPNYKAADQYVARPYAGHITVFRATCQTSRCARFPYLGWDTYAESVEAFTVPGDHYSLVQEPNAQVLGTVLNDCLKQIHQAEKPVLKP
jgi:thioesterase domain-containing protein/acyl carrier protein